MSPETPAEGKLRALATAALGEGCACRLQFCPGGQPRVALEAALTPKRVLALLDEIALLREIIS